MTRFSTLRPDGSESNVRIIPQSAMTRCPHFILMPGHYRTDNTCRCNDPDHHEMEGWGYTWNKRKGKWI